MKKIFILLLVIVLIVSGCEQKEVVEYNVLTPFGTPLLSILEIADNADKVYEDEYIFNTDIIYGPDPLIAGFNNGEYTFILAPTNLGAKLYNVSGNYLYAGAINFGSMYLVSEDPNFTISSLTNEEIIAFGQGSTPQIILEYILASYENTENVTVNYFASVSDVKFQMATAGFSVALVSEPDLSAYISEYGDLTIIDLQEEWEEISGMDSYPQAGLFVLNGTNSDVIETFINALNSSLEFLNNDSQGVLTAVQNLELGFDEDSIIESLAGCNIGFSSAENSRTELEFYFNIISDFNNNLIGGTLPGDDFYYSEN